MSYDEHLAERVRELVAGELNLTEKRMFGGLSFLIGGNMSVNVSSRGGLMVRVNPADAEALAGKPHARPMEMRDRPVDGWVRVEPEGLRTRAQLARWVARGVGYASSLPAKRS